MNPNKLTPHHETARDIPHGTLIAMGNLATLGVRPDSINEDVLTMNPGLREAIAIEAGLRENPDIPKAA